MSIEGALSSNLDGDLYIANIYKPAVNEIGPGVLEGHSNTYATGLTEFVSQMLVVGEPGSIVTSDE